MKKIIALCAVALTLGSALMSFDAEAARRFGGGRSVGMQRQSVTQPAPAPAAPHNAAPNAQQGAPAAGTAAAAT
jgi:hypothetical protein